MEKVNSSSLPVRDSGVAGDRIRKFKDHFGSATDVDRYLQHTIISRKTPIQRRVEAQIFSFRFKNEQILHSTHEHPLITCYKERNDKVCCYGCDDQITGQAYGCIQCNFYLHKSCAESSPRIEYYRFHPDPLYLENTNSGGRRSCKVCGNICSNFTYCCNVDECKFIICIQCASQLTPNIKYEDHQHLFALFENITSTFCEACGFRCVDFCVRCVACDINYHVQCGEERLPSTIVYEEHEHPLTLINLHEKDVEQFYCHSCKKEVNLKGPFYFCGICNWNFHIHCVVSKIKVEERDKVKSLSHRHSLFRYNNDNDDVCCNACNKSISGPSFCCSRCNFFLHELCFKLSKVRHPFHQHPLIYSSKTSFTCNACQNRCHGDLVYHCDGCKFYLDEDCALLKPSIKYKGHEHRLTFFKKIFDDLVCEACKLTNPNASYLRCVECNYSVHLFCVPLPCTIKHECHIHPLTLKDFFVEDNTGEYYCDACETKRDPRECVYHCAYCSDYVAHVSCVIDEVLLSLSRGHEDVKLRNVDRQIADNYFKESVTLLKEVVNSSNKDEEEELKRVQEAMDDWFRKIKSGDEYKNSDSILEENLYGYLDNAFILFLERLESSMKEKKLTMPFWDLESEVVKVGDYMVSRNCAPIINTSFEIHKDIISVDSKLSLRIKTHFLNMLGGVLHSMYNTKVKDITENLLIDWWKNLKLVQHAGFKIQFALDCLNRLAQARFDVERELKQDKTLRSFQVEIEDLTNKLEQLKRQQKSYIITSRSKRPTSYNDVLIETLELRLKSEDHRDMFK